MSSIEDVRAAKEALLKCIETTEGFPGKRNFGVGIAKRETSDEYYLRVTVEATDMLAEMRTFVEQLEVSVEVDFLLSGKVTAQLNG